MIMSDGGGQTLFWSHIRDYKCDIKSADRIRKKEGPELTRTQHLRICNFRIDFDKPEASCLIEKKTLP